MKSKYERNNNNKTSTVTISGAECITPCFPSLVFVAAIVFVDDVKLSMLATLRCFHF